MKTWGLLALVIVICGILGFFVYDKRQTALINSFEECAAAGNPVMTSYPGQCRTKDGRLFVENIGNELDLHDIILISSPRPNTAVANPIVITGQARGPWYFEASFPAELVDANNTKIGSAIVQADGEWMTEEFVPFTATLSFTSPTTTTGTLLLHKSNPSGLPENDETLSIPVRF